MNTNDDAVLDCSIEFTTNLTPLLSGKDIISEFEIADGISIEEKAGLDVDWKLKIKDELTAFSQSLSNCQAEIDAINHCIHEKKNTKDIPNPFKYNNFVSVSCLNGPLKLLQQEEL